ncbi:MAG: hypothetical protein IJ191_08375 [Treponema sp.]|nr:hypothetical protein [Treponema sp.]
MMMKRRRRAIRLLLCISFWGHGIHGTAQETYSTAELLAAYLAYDLDMHLLTAELEKQQLAAQITGIDTGFDIQLATGTASFQFGDQTRISFSPSISATIPAAKNLRLSASTEMEHTQSKTTFRNTTFTASMDIISDADSARTVTLLKTERAVREAERALRNRALTAEKAFYTELKSLYQIASALASMETELYDDTIELERIRVQGYVPTSPQYRRAQMDVYSDEHAVALYQRELETKTALFLRNCGIDSVASVALDFLPDDIPTVSAVDVLSFDKAQYAAIESAQWNHFINERTRQAERKFSLAINGGYTIGNGTTNSDTVDAGLAAAWRGLSVGAGVSVPVGGAVQPPAYTLGIGIDVAQFRRAPLVARQNALSDMQETIALEQAEREYENMVLERQRQLADIIWEHRTNQESYELYEQLARDTKEWYAAGIVTESEYRLAEANRKNYQLAVIMNRIDLIIYNDDTSLLFCQDEREGGYDADTYDEAD